MNEDNVRGGRPDYSQVMMMFAAGNVAVMTPRQARPIYEPGQTPVLEGFQPVLPRYSTEQCWALASADQVDAALDRRQEALRETPTTWQSTIENQLTGRDQWVVDWMFGGRTPVLSQSVDRLNEAIDVFLARRELLRAANRRAAGRGRRREGGLHAQDHANLRAGNEVTDGEPPKQYARRGSGGRVTTARTPAA